MYNTRNYLCTLLYISCKAYGPFFVPLFFLAHLLVILGLGLLMYICFHAPLCTHTTIIIIIQFFILSLCSASFMVSTSHNGSLRNQGFTAQRAFVIDLYLLWLQTLRSSSPFLSHGRITIKHINPKPTNNRPVLSSSR